MKVLCDVYKSLSKPDYYLYVGHDDDLSELPQNLLTYFGKTERAMTLELHEGRRLAAATATDVLRALREKGYYLQMPPGNDAYMQAVRKNNEKL